MTNVWVTVASFGYLALLFGVALLAEQLKNKTGKAAAWLGSPYVYALSLAVYCTAWTYYGSVGRAAEVGLEFLTIYIGPTLVMPVWWVVVRKIIRISKALRIGSIADFLSSRYGKSATIGVIVTLFCLLGIIPYISIQLKAIAESFSILSGTQQGHAAGFWQDGAFYITLVLALFTTLFGIRKIEATEQRTGLVASIAFESIVKLLAFLIVGAFVTYGCFDGLNDIFNRAKAAPDLSHLFTFPRQTAYGDWFWATLVSMLAVTFLPRQFQLAVVENRSEAHLDKAIWLFPLYLLLINLFVLPIAVSGKLLLGNSAVSPDTYVLAIPLFANADFIAWVAYLGGFSAATSMIIVSAIAVSIMLSHNVVMPLWLSIAKAQVKDSGSQLLLYTRTLSIIIVLAFAYWFYRSLAMHYSLVSIGLVSFVAVAQFAPAALGGLYWKDGNRNGAITGIMLGFCIWFYTMQVPLFAETGLLPTDWVNHGPGGITWLKPTALFGLTDLGTVAHATFWSLLLNAAAYITVSLQTRATMQERIQAQYFVDIYRYAPAEGDSIENSSVWQGKAYLSDLVVLLINFLGEARAKEAVQEFYERFPDTNKANQQADARMVTYVENLLAGAVGTASARKLVATVTQEEPQIAIAEVLEIARESQQIIAYSRELEQTSEDLRSATEELQRAYEQLRQTDELKDEFLYNVTHEVRTPITSIRALAEIVYDNPELSPDERAHFLHTIIKESERLTRLISQVLDLERFDSGKMQLQIEHVQLHQLIAEVLESVTQLAEAKGLTIQTNFKGSDTVEADADKLTQVMVNLLSNAIKFAPETCGSICITTLQFGQMLRITVEDNGKGIEMALQQVIFEKFFQAKNQHIRKPKGSGLGLAICKKIVELHGGEIGVSSEPGKGATFYFTLPLQQPKDA